MTEIATLRADYEASPEFARTRGLLIAEKLIAVIERLADMDHATVAAVVCAAAEELGAGMPALRNYRQAVANDAATWADCATPHELATYIAAGLTKCDRRAFARNTRKRLLVSLWNSLPPEDRAAFLEHVDPGPGAKA